jgi:4-hydroxy-tetrahydrodipicolinate synthase
VKEASGNISQIAEVCATVPDDFLVFSGDDAITIPVAALGGAGVISVVSNEIPQEMAELTRCALEGDWKKARTLQRKFLPLMQANFIESNPMPVKCVLAMMGKIEENYRLPMVKVRPETRAKLERITRACGVI